MPVKFKKSSWTWKSSVFPKVKVEKNPLQAWGRVQTAFPKTEAKFKEFETRLKFKPRLKYGWDHLKFNAIFRDLSSSSIETGFWGIWDVV